MIEPIHVISLGAGVQSSTMLAMAASGELIPKPQYAIFADTQREPDSVYRWLEWLEANIPIPIIRVSRGNLAKEAAVVVISKKSGKPYTSHNIPVFIKNLDGSQGTQGRQCTKDFKVLPIRSWLWNLRKTLPSPKPQIVMWIGISVDEAHRMKPSRVNYITHSFPLVDAGISRKDCITWMSKNNLPTPPRSACDFCPYHSPEEWLYLKNAEPQVFQRAVDFEKEYQSTLTQIDGVKGIPFLHRDMVPLDQVDFSKSLEKHPDQFGNECEGMCGI